MKRLKWIVAVALLCPASVEAWAQRVLVEGDNRVTIECTGMPARAITEERKARTTTATVDKLPDPNDSSDIASAASNEKMYIRLQVHATPNESDKPMTWLEGIQYCAGLTSGGISGWRLPTKHELQLLRVLHTELVAFGASVFTPFAAGNYWSATGYSTTESWQMNFNNGATYSQAKRIAHIVRCVRDI